MSSTPPKTVAVSGPPVTPELQRVFGAHAGGSMVEGLIVENDGIRVLYNVDGSRFELRFVPYAIP